jgi:hypothetical protein
MVPHLHFRYTHQEFRLVASHDVAVERIHLRESMMSKLLETVREKTGIYSSGFNPASAVGLLLPVLFVIVVGGGIAAYLIWSS